MKISEQISYLSRFGISLSEAQILENKKKRVIVGMSGGVDSSVCAALLKLQGFEVIGMFMKNWEEKDENGVCTSEKDYQDVISVCEKLDLPYYSVDFVAEYQKNVFSHFLEEYEKGYTPNPDILCNREIKFKVFFDKAMELGADFLATGHYCQIKEMDGEKLLMKGADRAKDQTYFLYAIDKKVLDRVLFPIGHLEKKFVREIARDFDLATKAKKDSTGICFIGERNFKNFLSNYIAKSRGNFVRLDDNKVIATHDGHCFYTVGQRKGLGIGGPGGPWFVAKKDIKTNTVYVVEGEDHPALYASELWTLEENFLKELSFPLRAKAKIRYRGQDEACTIDRDGEVLKVIFDRPQRAISLRQSVVFYDEEICLGGGVINQIGKTSFELTKDLDHSSLSV